jgi:hypothetical protein
MALATTTLSTAATATDKSIVVAAATSFAAGRLIRVDQEMMQVVQSYVSGTTVGVLRGRGGTAASAHVVTAKVVHGSASDFDNSAAQQFVGYPVSRPVVITSITATPSTLVHAPAGSDHRVILNGTDAITLTIPVPTIDMDGDMLVIISNGAAAHVPTFTGGLGGAGTGYDAITNNATGQMALVAFAANAVWNIPQAPALTGTVTNITGGIA